MTLEASTIEDSRNFCNLLTIFFFDYPKQLQNNWTKTPENTLKVCSICHDLCEASLEAFATMEENQRALIMSQLSSARLTTQGCVKVVKSSEWSEQCKEQIEVLEAFLETIKDKLLANV